LLVGPGEFISEDRVQLNEWTTVIAERNRNDGSLIVNEATAVKGLASALLFIHSFILSFIHSFIHSFILLFNLQVSDDKCK